jgi:hypothetical protein
MALGFTSSILLHETAHIAASLAVGAKPQLGLDKGRPTIYSGIDEHRDPRKQLIFSTAGLTAQAILDEAILDIPHRKGGPFERGLLAGGITTAFFYATIGRNASNSDITYIERSSSLSKTQASLIYAGVALMHTVRIARDAHYANFFVRPAPSARIAPQETTPATVLRVGVAIHTE